MQSTHITSIEPDGVTIFALRYTFPNLFLQLVLILF
jgi:hypothetical protein